MENEGRSRIGTHERHAASWLISLHRYDRSMSRIVRGQTAGKIDVIMRERQRLHLACSGKIAYKAQTTRIWALPAKYLRQLND
jgi:hypothetical protein